MPEGAAGTVMVTLHPDMVTATPTIVGVEGPLGPTLSISYNLQGVDARCNEAHHRRNLIDHDPGGNNTIMECGMALHEYNSCDEIWGRLHSICGPRRDELVTGIAPPAIGKFEELCPTNEEYVVFVYSLVVLFLSGLNCLISLYIVAPSAHLSQPPQPHGK